MKAYIQAISYHLPERVFTNDDFFSLFPESLNHKSNLKKIGISERRIAAPDETASDLAVKAAEKLFAEHQISPLQVDFILFCAQEFDYYTPTTACIIQSRLNIPTHCGAMDFNQGCTGYVYGLSLAKGFIESMACRNVLLLTASTVTRKFHPRDRSSRFLFGDGAAATLICTREKQGIGQFVFGTDGSRADRIIIRDGGARNPITEASFVDISDEFGNTTNQASLYMNGAAIFNFGLKTVPTVITETLLKNNKSMEDIDMFVFHQANLFLIQTIAKKMNIPDQKIFNFVETVGNTVSSTIPIVLAEGLKCGKIRQGYTVLVCGFGTGLSWAATCIEL